MKILLIIAGNDANFSRSTSPLGTGTDGDVSDILADDRQRKHLAKISQNGNRDSTELVASNAPKLSEPPCIVDADPSSPPPDLGLPMNPKLSSR